MLPLRYPRLQQMQSTPRKRYRCLLIPSSWERGKANYCLMCLWWVTDSTIQPMALRLGVEDSINRNLIGNGSVTLMQTLLDLLSFDVPASTFFGYVQADIQSRWDLRCTWEYSRKTMVVDVPEWKEERDGWLWPLPEPTGELSAPARIPEESLRLDAPVIDWLLEPEEEL
jgi:hypothetical protein